MRETALKISLLVVLGLAVPNAQASPAKTHAAAHKPTPAAHTLVRTTKRMTVPERRPIATKATRSRHSAAQLPVARHTSRTRHAARPEPRVIAQRTTPAPIVRVPPPATQPASEADPIHVTHDRKQHFSSDPGSSPINPPDDRSAPPPTATDKHAPAPIKPTPPVIVPVLYNKHGRLIVPPALKGSHEILIHQNEMADHDGLDRVQDDADLDRLRDAKLLVLIPSEPGMQLDERLPANRRYCRPWTEQFLTTLARAYYARFHSSLQVNSAVRTIEVQERLLRTNGNAAPAEGQTASPHLTGQAIDLAKHGLSMTQIAWLRGYLLPLVQSGKVDVEEEFQQACFHISVYRKYLPQPAPKRDITPHTSPATALATAIR